MEKQHYVFPNGMRVVLVPNSSLPIVKVRGWIKGGNALSVRRSVGSLVPQMINKGTRGRSCEEFEDALAEYALEYSAFVSGTSCFFMEWSGAALREYVGELLEVVSDSLRNPIFPDTELGILQKRLISSIQESESDPESRAESEILSMLYGRRHPYFGMSSDESIAQFRSVTRDDLVSFWKKYYSPDRSGLVIVGDIDSDSVRDTLKEAFGKWRPVERTAKDEYDETRNEYGSDGYEERVVFIPEKPSAVLLVGQCLDIDSTHPDYPALRLGVSMLGGGSHARLFQHVREKRGLSYHTAASLNRMHTMPGYFSALAHTNPENIQRTQEELWRVVAEFCSSGITAKELRQEKKVFRGRKIRADSSFSGVAGDIAMEHITGIASDEFMGKISALTAKEVNNAIYEHLDPSCMKVVRVGTVS